MLVYLPASIGMARLFLLAASLSGKYTSVARIGSMVWVGHLAKVQPSQLKVDT
jgi:hypothetical protein